MTGRPLRIFLLVGLAPLALAARAGAQVDLPNAKPVPRVQMLPLPDDQASFELDGRELARYWFAPRQRRPFVYPIVGPSGRPLTRMGHPRDPIGHSHHNSFWVAHHDVNGDSFWEDRGPARIAPRRILRYDDADDAAALLAENAWIGRDDRVHLIERRGLTLRPLPDGESLLILDLQLEAAGAPATLGKTPFGLVGVRMAKTIGVKDGGGTIRNSEGNVDEQGPNGVFWKHARWVDYSGPIAPGVAEGLTLFDHPANPNHPSVFHVRVDGWMGSSLTFDAPRTIEPGRPLRLRYALYAHKGVPKAGTIDAVWDEFARAKVEPLPEK